MGMVLAPLRQWAPGVVTLLVEIVAGTAIYAAFVAAFDVAGLRNLAFVKLRSWREKVAEAVE